ncbi:MAG: hypothetical protein ACTHXA_06610 [Gulosibacter sp.]|uniref:hypothetical protein n=1 Tax=Gulosibacter sp. TaxID=2817531 RepID=UPI003F91C332
MTNDPFDVIDLEEYPREFQQVLKSASEFQRIVPDATMVGGSAAAFWARHRLSVDHDHVVADLAPIYDDVLKSLESEPAWRLARADPDRKLTILGSYEGVEAGVRQLRRKKPLETVTVLVQNRPLRIPTAVESLRIKAFLVVQRNQVRDYLDVAAMTGYLGVEQAAHVLESMDDYYSPDLTKQPAVSVAGQVAGRLANPEPKDSRVIGQLDHYKGLDRAFTDWAQVVTACQEVAERMEPRND